MTPVKSTCPYCGVGCGVIIGQDSSGQLKVSGDDEHPANEGRLCSKGAALTATLNDDDRLLYPEVGGRVTDWDDALSEVAARFASTINEHGPDSVGFYVSGQLLTEDYYVVNKLAKGYLGTANIDTNSRLCMASSVAGHRKAFGMDTVPGTYGDFDHADLVVLVGSNLAWCHPVLYQRLEAAIAKRPQTRVVLIDPRRTASVPIADMHLQIKPDGDAALFAGLLAWLTDHAALDTAYIAAHTNGFIDALAQASALSDDDLVTHTGLALAEMQKFFKLFAETPNTVTVYSQGVNQSASGTDKVSSILNCHLATGRIGRPGSGPFSVTGQPNAMGGREVGGLANMLACHMDIENPVHRDRVQRFWNSPTMASGSGLKAVDMFQALGSGKIKAIWVMATNPAVSMPEADNVRQALRDCPFVVVSDIYRETDTTRLAHVKLPATGWGEKVGTVTNSERRISRQRAFREAPGEARSDWWQIVEVARRMGFTSGFDYSGPADIFREYAALSAYENDDERDFDIGACAKITDVEYEAMRPFQWPAADSVVQEKSGIEKRFFASGRFFTPDRKGRFVAVKVAPPKVADPRWPLTLNTGRIRDQWHTMTRTGQAAVLSGHRGEPFCEINPDDARERGVETAHLVRVASPHGYIVVRARVTDNQSRGAIFVPMHWTDQFASRARVDSLVKATVDPFSGQPAFKNVPVSIVREEPEMFGFLVSREKPSLEYSKLMYWAIARCSRGWRLEFALDTAEEGDALLYNLLDGPERDDTIGYRDGDSGRSRCAKFTHSRLDAALYLSPEPVLVSRNWLAEQLEIDHEDIVQRFRVLAGKAGAGAPNLGNIVCACRGVGTGEINKAVERGCRSVSEIASVTTAGSNCGSCRAEIAEMLRQYETVAETATD